MNPIEAAIDELLAPLRRQRIRCTREVDTHADLARIWRAWAHNLKDQSAPWHEHRLEDNQRIDFFHARTSIGIEVKIKGSSQAIARQLLRYAMTGQVSALILITAKPLESFPESFSVRGQTIPVHVHVLNHI